MTTVRPNNTCPTWCDQEIPADELSIERRGDGFVHTRHWRSRGGLVLVSWDSETGPDLTIDSGDLTDVEAAFRLAGDLLDAVELLRAVQLEAKRAAD